MGFGVDEFEVGFVTSPRTGRMEVLLPTAMAQSVLDAVIRLNVEAVLARAGQRPATVERGRGYEQFPGVMCWPVTYTTGIPPQQD